MHKPTDPLEIKILMFYEGLAENNATSRAVRELKKDLEAKRSKSHCFGIAYRCQGCHRL